MTVGWVLDRRDRARLLAIFPPRWPVAVADHVTLASGRHAELPRPARVTIVGEADDGHGVQALVVEVDGSTSRPDGGTFHVTWSLDRARGRLSRASNAMIARHGWRALPPMPVEVIPARWTWVDP